MRELGMKITYFPSPADLRHWFEEHHAAVAELWVGYHKKGSGEPSITWPESVDVASASAGSTGFARASTSIATRSASRRGSHGASGAPVNIKRVQELTAQGQMRPAGLKAFAAAQGEPLGHLLL